MSIIEALQALEKEALSSLEAATSAEEVESWRIEYLSRQGKLPKILEGMRDVAPADRPAVGKAANTVKSKLSSSLEERQADFEGGEAELPEDPSLPGKPYPDGSIHVLQQTRDEMVSIFRRLGFALAEGPEIETEFKNFDALNTPPDHPARNEQDTFYPQSPPQRGRGSLSFTHPYLPGANSYHAGVETTDSYYRPRTMLPARRSRCHPWHVL
jgi:phenylalanyl-tRNA synthetase alpha chain